MYLLTYLLNHSSALASCIIYARALLEYIITMWLRIYTYYAVPFCYQDVRSVKFAEDKVLTFLIFREKC